MCSLEKKNTFRVTALQVAHHSDALTLPRHTHNSLRPICVRMLRSGQTAPCSIISSIVSCLCSLMRRIARNVFFCVVSQESEHRHWSSAMSATCTHRLADGIIVCGLAVGISGSDICARIPEQKHRLEVAFLRRLHHSSCADAVRRYRCKSEISTSAKARHALGCWGHCQSPILGVDIGPLLDKKVGRFESSVGCCPHDRCDQVSVARVDICTIPQQLLALLQVPFSRSDCRVDERACAGRSQLFISVRASGLHQQDKDPTNVTNLAAARPVCVEGCRTT